MISLWPFLPHPLGPIHSWAAEILTYQGPNPGIVCIKLLCQLNDHLDNTQENKKLRVVQKQGPRKFRFVFHQCPKVVTIKIAMNWITLEQMISKKKSSELSSVYISSLHSNSNFSQNSGRANPQCNGPRDPTQRHARLAPAPWASH